MTMQLFKFQTNRLSFRPTALKTLFRPCSEKHTLESNRKGWSRISEHKTPLQFLQHSQPMLNTAPSWESQREGSQIPSQIPSSYHRHCPGPQLPLGFTGSPVQVQFPRLSLVSVHFLQNCWPQQMCNSGISIFFSFSCQYLSHLFPESAAVPKSASVTFRFEVFRSCLLGKHLPCLPAHALPAFPPPIFSSCCSELPSRPGLSIPSWSAPLTISIPILFVLPCTQRCPRSSAHLKGEPWGECLL